jgi:hypothetical protein
MKVGLKPVNSTTHKKARSINRSFHGKFVYTKPLFARLQSASQFTTAGAHCSPQKRAATFNNTKDEKLEEKKLIQHKSHF